MARGGGRRTYVRDGRGRFASTPGGGAPKRPPTRRASRSPGRLTRDNAGRITSIGGNGATARGGRLRTAAGNLRARQVDRLRVAPIKGAVTRSGKRRGPQREAAKPATPSAQPRGRFESLGFRPGVFMSAYGRPVGVIGIPRRRARSPYVAGVADMAYRIGPTNDDKKARLANAGLTKSLFERLGLVVKYSSSRDSSTIASYNPATKQMTINRSHTSWVNPALAQLNSRRRGFMSSASPLHTFYHELGHVRDKKLLHRSMPFGNLWMLATSQGPSQETRIQRGHEMQQLARRVSTYATFSPSEFIAETYAGLKAGHRYDHRVMGAYREAMGLPARPPARHRSRRRKPKA